MKRLGLLAAGLIALSLISAPAHATSRSHAEAVARSSDSASIWHRPGRGYLVQDAAQMQSLTVRPRHVAMTACGARPCRTTTLAYYRGLNRQWRTLNRNLWSLVSSLPRCGNDFGRDCAQGNGAVHLGQRWFVAEQRAVFV